MRTQVVCRVHVVLCQLLPGDVSKEITANHAAFLLGSIIPAGVVEAARCELAAAFLDDLRRIDAQLGDAKKKLTAAVRASGTTLTKVFGVGPVVAATVVGDVRDASRFPDRDHFAAYVGTAPIEVSSGPRKIYRLSACTLGAAPSPALWPPGGGKHSATCLPAVACRVTYWRREWPVDARPSPPSRRGLHHRGRGGAAGRPGDR